MARRATTLTKRRSAAREMTPVEISEPEQPKSSRRRKRAQQGEMTAAAEPVANGFSIGAEELAVAPPASPAAGEAAKVRRGRKPKPQPTPDVPIEAPAMDAESVKPDRTAKKPTTPRRKRQGRSESAGEHAAESTNTAAAPVSEPVSAAQWDAGTGTASFDWPSIEQVAATEGPNQAMAKLLLAARAEGANSRWPF